MSQEKSKWYQDGYRAGCQYLSNCSDMDLLDHIDAHDWEGEEPECLEFTEGFGDAYGCDDEEDSL